MSDIFTAIEPLQQGVQVGSIVNDDETWRMQGNVLILQRIMLD